MEVFKRGKYWNYRFDAAKINGNRQRIQKGGYRTKKEAEIAGIKAERDYINTGQVYTPSEISVSDFYDMWLNEYCTINCKITTLEGYKKRIKNYILPAIGKYRLSSLTAIPLQKLINDLFNAGYSRNTLISIKGILTGAMDYAVQPLGLIQYNPAHAIRLPSPRAIPKVTTRKKEKIPLTDKEMKVILERFPEGHPAHIPLQLAYRLGLREGEAFALTWADIDFDNYQININKQVQYINGFWTFVPPKYDSKRSVYMDSKLFDLLIREKNKQELNRLNYNDLFTRYYIGVNNEIIKSDNGNEVFFVNIREDGSYIQPRILQNVGRVVHYRLGLKHFDYHSLRHTHATTLYTNGASLLDIKERLGHCNIRTTERYTHNNDEIRNRTKTLIENIYGLQKNDSAQNDSL